MGKKQNQITYVFAFTLVYGVVFVYPSATNTFSRNYACLRETNGDGSPLLLPHSRACMSLITATHTLSTWEVLGLYLYISPAFINLHMNKCASSKILAMDHPYYCHTRKSGRFWGCICTSIVCVFEQQNTWFRM